MAQKMDKKISLVCEKKEDMDGVHMNAMIYLFMNKMENKKKAEPCFSMVASDKE